MARRKSKRRRNSFPNAHALPTFTSRFESPITRLARALSVSAPNPTIYWNDDIPSQRPISRPLPQKRVNVDVVSHFPKSYGVRETPVRENERLRICSARAMREEVIHAIGKSGRGGQKSPRWTKKSKVRC